MPERFSIRQGSGAIIFGGVAYAIMGENRFQQFVVPALPGIGIFFIAFSYWRIRRMRKRRQERLKYATLSRDELAKARSKLRNSMSPARQAEVNMPDIDLKY